MTARLVAIDRDMQLRDHDQPLGKDVNHAGNRLHQLFHFGRLLPQDVEILAENLDRNLRAHPGEEVIDAM